LINYGQGNLLQREYGQTESLERTATLPDSERINQAVGRLRSFLSLISALFCKPLLVDHEIAMYAKTPTISTIKSSISVKPVSLHELNESAGGTLQRS